MAAAAAYSLSGAILCAAALLCLWAVCVPAPGSLSALLLGTAALLAATLLLVTMEGRGRSASAPPRGQLLELRVNMTCRFKAAHGEESYSAAI
jgi:hypothetical protein